MADNQLTGNYKETETYKKADGQTRTKIERFKKENKIENNHMYLLLLREDYRNLPKEEKQKGNRAPEIMVISGIISFLVATARQAMNVLPYIGIYMIVVSAIYFSGILNPIGRQLSNINKLLKKFPKTPSIREYLKEEESEE
ncbi:MAG: hypothetical protein IKS54_10500 [Erysipelotrichaceae bacterium]|nr:hypothetical protein [Erysipelotrichaceae bacterium]